MEREYRFCDRKWRADFAHLPSRTLIEIEGGIWSGGRHSRGSGFEQDCEKYLEAALLGWRVLRLTGKQLELGTVERIVAMVERSGDTEGAMEKAWRDWHEQVDAENIPDISPAFRRGFLCGKF